MANTIAKCYGYDRGRVKEDHRLGSEAAVATAATWRTIATCQVRKDGSGDVQVTQNGIQILSFTFGPEDPVIDPVTLAVS